MPPCVGGCVCLCVRVRGGKTMLKEEQEGVQKEEGEEEGSKKEDEKAD